MYTYVYLSIYIYIYIYTCPYQPHTNTHTHPQIHESPTTGMCCSVCVAVRVTHINEFPCHVTRVNESCHKLIGGVLNARSRDPSQVRSSGGLPVEFLKYQLYTEFMQ